MSSNWTGNMRFRFRQPRTRCGWLTSQGPIATDMTAWGERRKERSQVLDAMGQLKLYGMSRLSFWERLPHNHDRGKVGRQRQEALYGRQGFGVFWSLY